MKKIIAIAIACLIVCGISGCGSTSSSDEPSGTVSSSSNSNEVESNVNTDKIDNVDDNEVDETETTEDEEVIGKGICNDHLSWELSSSGVLHIFGEGEMMDFDTYKNTPWYSVYKYITSVVIEDGVTSVGDYAFYYCMHLTSITIERDVVRIGEKAFASDKNLTDIYYSGSESDWALISIDTEYENLTGKTIHYNSNE